jgi:cell division protein FtsI/penicillin-binding protein 2
MVMIPGVLYALVFENENSAQHFSTDKQTPQNRDIEKSHPRPEKTILKRLQPEQVNNLTERSVTVSQGEHRYRLQTTLDIDLQSYLLRELDPSTARYIAIVAMEPGSGRILAMVGFDKYHPRNNPCLANDFPAASLFKIVTAAAAIETCGFAKHSIIRYNGQKYTLYKSQINERVNKWTHQVSFEKSFAESINPVFGKLGVHCLKKVGLTSYAEAFGFNKDLKFDIDVNPSRFVILDDPYNWSEIASGFNRQTKITPLHSAILASIIVNNGKFVPPFLIENIKDPAGNTIYQRDRTDDFQQAIRPETSTILLDLMKATVSSGTGKKAFRGKNKDQILSRLEIGGKTGSIDTSDHDARIDWFAGFAQEIDGSEKLALGVVVAHEKFIGVRANSYARKLISYYFGNFFAKKSGNSSGQTG